MMHVCRRVGRVRAVLARRDGMGGGARCWRGGPALIGEMLGGLVMVMVMVLLERAAAAIAR